MELDLKIVTLARDARSYYDAYEVLNEKTQKLRNTQVKKIEQHQKLKGVHVPMPLAEHDMDLSTPSLVCLVFSLELHSKLLLRTYDIIATGHDIGELMDKLPEEERASISSHSDFHPVDQGKGFARNISIASKLFTRTRYYFEKLDNLHFNTGFCITLTKIIRKKIVDREPYLKYDLGAFAD